MNEYVNSASPRFFKLYIAIVASLSLIILAAILAILIFAGLKLKSESKTITTKVNSFNTQVKDINNNLNNINQELKLARPAGL